MCLMHVELGFSSFFANFFDIFEKSSNLTKNEEKSLVQLSFNPFLHCTAGKQICKQICLHICLHIHMTYQLTFQAEQRKKFDWNSLVVK